MCYWNVYYKTSPYKTIATNVLTLLANGRDHAFTLAQSCGLKKTQIVDAEKVQ